MVSFVNFFEVSIYDFFLVGCEIDNFEMIYFLLFLMLLLVSIDSIIMLIFSFKWFYLKFCGFF